MNKRNAGGVAAMEPLLLEYMRKSCLAPKPYKNGGRYGYHYSCVISAVSTDCGILLKPLEVVVSHAYVKKRQNLPW